MALIYIFKIDDSINSGAFPPSVMSSDWYATFTNYAALNAIGGIPGFTYTFIFDDKSDLTKWLTDHAIPDDLKDDMNRWTIDHNVSYTSTFYQLPTVDNEGLI